MTEQRFYPVFTMLKSLSAKTKPDSSDFEYMDGSDLVMRKPGNPGKLREFASVRINGDDSTLVWPDGKVTKLVSESGLLRPKEADHRMFWLTVAMNQMAKNGYEFVYMNGPDLVMARVIKQ